MFLWFGSIASTFRALIRKCKTYFRHLVFKIMKKRDRKMLHFCYSSIWTPPPPPHTHTQFPRYSLSAHVPQNTRCKGDRSLWSGIIEHSQHLPGNVSNYSIQHHEIDIAQNWGGTLSAVPRRYWQCHKGATTVDHRRAFCHIAPLHINIACG